MFKPTNLLVAVLLGVCTASSILAQSITKEPVDTAPIVTASATGERVRFAAPGAVGQLRLQILSAGGQMLFEVQGKGNVLDWTLHDGNGNRLLDGSYLCVVTIKSLSGRLSRRLGSLELSGPQVNLQAIDRLQMTDLQQQTVGPVEPEAGISVLQASEVKAATTLAHDGNQAELTRSNGALSFRLGDFFSGTDTEQMVLTEEGNLGIGTDKPQSKLEVSGDIRATGTVQASKGIAFADGTVQTTGLSARLDGSGNVIPSVAGTGTTNQVTKWTDNAGTLGDSTITEVSGRVGIGVASPTYRLVVGPDIGPGLTTSDLTISRGAGQSVSIYAGATGAHGMNFGWDEGNQRAFVNAPVQSPITFTTAASASACESKPTASSASARPRPRRASK